MVFNVQIIKLLYLKKERALREHEEVDIPNMHQITATQSRIRGIVWTG